MDGWMENKALPFVLRAPVIVPMRTLSPGNIVELKYAQKIIIATKRGRSQILAKHPQERNVPVVVPEACVLIASIRCRELSEICQTTCQTACQHEQQHQQKINTVRLNKSPSRNYLSLVRPPLREFQLSLGLDCGGKAIVNVREEYLSALSTRHVCELRAISKNFEPHPWYVLNRSPVWLPPFRLSVD